MTDKASFVPSNSEYFSILDDQILDYFDNDNDKKGSNGMSKIPDPNLTVNGIRRIGVPAQSCNVSDIADLLRVGHYVQLDLTDGRLVEGVIGEIQPSRFFIWQNDFPGTQGVINPQTYGFKCSWVVEKSSQMKILVFDNFYDFGVNAPGTEPKKELKLEGLVLPNEILESIKSLLITHSSESRKKLFEEWGLGETIEKGRGMALLFYGVPGTGKTKCAESIATDLGLTVKMIGPEMLWSSEPGETERIIHGLFDNSNCSTEILVFDECETLVADRRRSGQILAAQTNAVLQCLERYEGITIFTTNRTPALDPAFERRLQLKVEFPAPDEHLRLSIWKKLIPAKLPLGECVKLERLAKAVLTGGYIKNVILNAARKAILENQEKVLMTHFEKSLQDELQGMTAFAEEDDTPSSIPPGFMLNDKGRLVKRER